LAAQDWARSSEVLQGEEQVLVLARSSELLVEQPLPASKKGEQLQITSESLLEFRLEQPASLPART